MSRLDEILLSGMVEASRLERSLRHFEANGEHEPLPLERKSAVPSHRD